MQVTPNALKHPSLWLLTFLCWLSALGFFSSQPAGTGPSWDLPHSDKILHFLCFSSGGFLLAGCLKSLGRPSISWPRIIRLTVLITALLGWLDEWHQCQVPGRSGADPWDWLADVLGGATGALAVCMLHHAVSLIACALRPRQPSDPAVDPPETSSPSPS